MSPQHPFQAPSLVLAAVIASADGVRGHVKVKCFLEDPSQFKDYSPFLSENGESTYEIEKVLSQDKDLLIVSFKGVTDRNQAESLNGSKLMFPRERLPELEEDTFYRRELMGLSVQSSQGHVLGKVQALHNFGAGDLLEVKTLEGKREMIPFTREVVPTIDMKEGALQLSTAGEMFLKGDIYDS
jgi:16S rRNA processing protein RimM